jgi:two-component system nitrate/nitrite response regulator NarL
VLVVAESPLFRSGLSAALSRVPEFEVAEERAALESAALARDMDLVVWELAAVDRATLGRVADLLEVTAAVFLLGSEAGVSELVRAGARGVLFRDTDAERLRKACSAVLAGASVFDEGMVELLIEPKRAEFASGVELTPREQEVLGLLAEGLSNKLIAARLGISEHTAKFHVNALLDKLGAETRTEAVVTAARRGLLMF